MKKISVIIPVHNEERRLSPCLERVIPFLRRTYPGEYEIVIVDNASTDDTLKIARSYVNTYPTVSALSVPLRGKGLAIKRGMAFAEGRYRYMCDVDLSTPIEALPDFMARIETPYDIVIGSREIVPRFVHTTLLRRVMGRAFHLLVNDLVPGVVDTQCGFKLFTDVAARAIFGRLQLPGMAFDVEALYLARMMGFMIGELPVQWEHNPDSRVRLVWDSLEMARDVAAIPWIHSQIEKIPA